MDVGTIDAFREGVTSLAKNGDELAYEFLVRRYYYFVYDHEAKLASQVFSALLHYANSEALRWLLPHHPKEIECSEATHLRDLIEAILDRNIKSISLDDLHRLSDLENVLAENWDQIISWDSDKDITEYEHVNVSYGNIRNMVNQELARRRNMDKADV